jgi:hypothetical protein
LDFESTLNIFEGREGSFSTEARCMRISQSLFLQLKETFVGLNDLVPSELYGHGGIVFRTWQLFQDQVQILPGYCRLPGLFLFVSQMPEKSVVDFGCGKHSIFKNEFSLMIAVNLGFDREVRAVDPFSTFAIIEGATLGGADKKTCT